MTLVKAQVALSICVTSKSNIIGHLSFEIFALKVKGLTLVNSILFSLFHAQV